jgi:hypothetical protein
LPVATSCQLSTLGEGIGKFAAPKRLFPLGSAPVSIAAGDFKQDGKLDVVVGNFGSGDPLTGSSIYILLGNGDGTFQPHTTLPHRGAIPEEVAVADLNGDGHPDIVVSNYFRDVCFRFSRQWRRKLSMPLRAQADGSGVGYLVIQDFNGDGIPDKAVANEAQGDIGVFLGKGDGSFVPVTPFGAPGANNGVSPLLAAGPLASGAKPDIVVVTSSFGQPTAVIVLRNITQ